MCKFERSISVLLLLLCALASRAANPACQIRLSSKKQPLITKSFGSKVILLSNLHGKIEFDNNDEVDAYCSTGFNKLTVNNRYGNVPFNSENSQRLRLKCISNKLYARKVDNADNDNIATSPWENEFYTGNGIQEMSCLSKVYSMYESRNNLTNCEHAMSYALGVKTITPVIIAGLCYDLEKLNLKYVTYKLHEPSSILANSKKFYPEGLNALSLKEPLKDISTFFNFLNNSDISSQLNSTQLTNFWLRIANYELDNIVQATTYYRSSFMEFDRLLNNIWWRNLRQGNWRRFNELLEKRAESLTYNIYTGTSGVVRVPTANKCENSTTLVINFENRKQAVPEFIWTYLHYIDGNVTEDFVVIAYNSPYFEYYDRETTVLCKDMCNEIDWLKPMHDSRYISTLGALYCCRPEEVIGHLDGFPLKTFNKTEVLTADSWLLDGI